MPTCRYLAQHSAFADLVDYSEFTAVVDPAELESANVIDMLEQRYDKPARLKLMKRLHQVPLQRAIMLRSWHVGSAPAQTAALPWGHV